MKKLLKKMTDIALKEKVRLWVFMILLTLYSFVKAAVVLAITVFLCFIAYKLSDIVPELLFAKDKVKVIFIIALGLISSGVVLTLSLQGAWKRAKKISQIPEEMFKERLIDYFILAIVYVLMVVVSMILVWLLDMLLSKYIFIHF